VVSTRRAGGTVAGAEPLIVQGCPVLVFDRVSYSGGRPVEHAESTYRGDRYELQMTVELGRS
jgi:DNA-binding GntR family transcriptional regulator